MRMNFLHKALHKALLGTLVCITAAMFGSCSNSGDSGTPATAAGFKMTVNGAGMTNRVISFGAPGAPTGTAGGGSVGVFSVKDDATGLAISGGTYKINGNDVTGVVTFPGKASGSFTFATDKASVTLTIGQGLTGEVFTSAENIGSLVVSEYGAVGGHIKGTFSGKMTYVNGITPGVVDVSGSFDAIRVADGQ